MSFMEIFQPGLKYLREERDRHRMLVAYPTNGGNPPMEIDLDAGTATVVVPPPPPESSDQTDSQQCDTAVEQAAEPDHQRWRRSRRTSGRDH